MDTRVLHPPWTKENARRTMSKIASHFIRTGMINMTSTCISGIIVAKARNKDRLI